MKRKITDLEQKLINDGWHLGIKTYTGKHSEKILCYGYYKDSEIKNNGKKYNQIITLDQKRTSVVDYGLVNVNVVFLNDQELCLLRFLHLELRHYVERLTKREPRPIEPLLNQTSGGSWDKDVEIETKQDLPPMTPEQFDELCQEMENKNEI